MDFKGADILTTKQFSRDDLEKIMQVAKKMEPIALKQKRSDLLSGYVMASLFYEPSTRTRLSFETAMRRLGGSVITAVGMQFSSLYKGETLERLNVELFFQLVFFFQEFVECVGVKRSG